jgi:hypothetical protein
MAPQTGIQLNNKGYFCTSLPASFLEEELCKYLP